MSLSSVAIGIKTFLRDEKLFRAIDGIRRTMPDAQMIIADDGDNTEEKDGLYAELIREGHKVILCPFDSGFGYKSNEIARVLDRPYLLVASDDFDFSPPSVAVGVEKMLDALERCAALSVVSGRVNNRVYEFLLYEKDGVVREGYIPDFPSAPFTCRKADLTANYSLIRRGVFKNISWDNDVKIGGGEHGAFFIDLQRSDYKVGAMLDININTQPGQDSARYRQYRERANNSDRPCFKKRGIMRYVLGNGQVDYEEK